MSGEEEKKPPHSEAERLKHQTEGVRAWASARVLQSARVSFILALEPAGSVADTAKEADVFQSLRLGRGLTRTRQAVRFARRARN